MTVWGTLSGPWQEGDFGAVGVGKAERGTYLLQQTLLIRYHKVDKLTSAKPVISSMPMPAEKEGIASRKIARRTQPQVAHRTYGHCCRGRTPLETPCPAQHESQCGSEVFFLYEKVYALGECELYIWRRLFDTCNTISRLMATYIATGVRMWPF